MQHKLNKEQIEDILKGVKYKDWTLRVIEKTADAILCQWIFYAIDNDDTELTKPPVAQHCRKWYVSCYSTVSEVIRTAHLAVQQAELHEINENFTYNNVRLFDPHMDLVALGNAGLKQDVRIEKTEKEVGLILEEKLVKHNFKTMVGLHGREIVEHFVFPTHFSPERINRIKKAILNDH